jgi:hypothetical protein
MDITFNTYIKQKGGRKGETKSKEANSCGGH